MSLSSSSVPRGLGTTLCGPLQKTSQQDSMIAPPPHNYLQHGGTRHYGFGRITKLLLDIKFDINRWAAMPGAEHRSLDKERDSFGKLKPWRQKYMMLMQVFGAEQVSIVSKPSYRACHMLLAHVNMNEGCIYRSKATDRTDNWREVNLGYILSFHTNSDFAQPSQDNYASFPRIQYQQKVLQYQDQLAKGGLLKKFLRFICLKRPLLSCWAVAKAAIIRESLETLLSTNFSTNLPKKRLLQELSAWQPFHSPTEWEPLHSPSERKPLHGCRISCCGCLQCRLELCFASLTLWQGGPGSE
jgi:hypothetical protein